MLYYLFKYLEDEFGFPGAGLFDFISFRAAMAVILSLVISLMFGGRLVEFLRKKQVGETIRDLGLKGQMQKQGTPTMGGIIILGAIIIPTLLFADVGNIYIVLILLVTVWMGLIGFIDDYIKVYRKNKEGLAGRFKLLGQVGVALIVGSVLYLHEDIKIRDYSTIYMYPIENGVVAQEPSGQYDSKGLRLPGKGVDDAEGEFFLSHDTRSTKTTIPFLKNNEFNYRSLVAYMSDGAKKIAFPVVFLFIIVLIITAVSNGANITDGLDGLATGTSAIIVFTLLVFSYVSGNVILADYLNIMYIPNSGELVVFSAAFVGSCIGFLWYNAFPAQVFMGDTGSLAIGGIIASLALIVRKELLIPVLCGIFLIENLSVMMQVSWFKYTRRKFGEGRRIFKMAPLHHHYQKLGMHESKIVTRFWIIGILLAIISIVTLKIR